MGVASTVFTVGLVVFIVMMLIAWLWPEEDEE